MEIQVIKGDITQLEVDAIVNAANNELRGGGGVDGAIHRVGGPEILAECKDIGFCETGGVVRTTGGRLKVKHLLHTVGPIYRPEIKSLESEVIQNERRTTDHIQNMQLQSCYRSSIKLAEDLGCRSIAFPNISTGVYGFPKERAVELVFEVMKDIMDSTSLKKIVFCCFDEENYQLYQERFEK
jgi:O-acetyl-ADP-ribose deacetylase (regulator of RNase III)